MWELVTGFILALVLLLALGATVIFACAWRRAGREVERRNRDYRIKRLERQLDNWDNWIEKESR